MKKKILLLTFSLLSSSAFLLADPDFTPIGSCAPYLVAGTDRYTREADSTYLVNKSSATFTIDAVANEPDWSRAEVRVVNKLIHDVAPGGTLDLSVYPQTQTDLYGTFKALWTVDGVYMFISVVDNHVRYQNPDFQWENDAVEFYFASEVGSPSYQIIIPSMVGTTHPSYPAALPFESGCQHGSNAAFTVLGAKDAWTADNFSWAIKKTDLGYDVELFVDANIVTNGNIEKLALNNYIATDVNIDEADSVQNTNDPALYVRESTVGLLGHESLEYQNSNYYGHYKFVDTTCLGCTPVPIVKGFTPAAYYNGKGVVVLKNVGAGAKVSIYSVTGKLVAQKNNASEIGVADLTSGIYFVKINGGSPTKFVIQ